MSDKPLWRQAYDQLAAEVGPRLQEFTASEEFAGLVEVGTAIQARVDDELGRASRRFLHAVNLPAASDITLLRREIGDLERQVRALSRRLEELGEDVPAIVRSAPAAVVDDVEEAS